MRVKSIFHRRMARRSSGSAIRGLLSAAFAMALFAPASQAAQLYVTQGFVDYAVGGVGVRSQNASNTGTCNGTADNAYYALPANFSVSVPAGSTVDRAYLFWGGSITNAGNADATVTATFNGSASTITGTTQTGSSSLGYTYYKGTADVTTQLAAAAPSGGTITVSVNNFTLNASPSKAACGAAGGATLVVVYTTDLNGAGVEPRAVAIDDVALATELEALRALPEEGDDTDRKSVV